MKIRNVAGGVVIGPRGKIVVVNQNGNSWSLPKGGVDPGESPREAAAREIKEESGLDEIEYVADLGVYRRHKIPLSENHSIDGELKEITMFLYKTKQSSLLPEDPDNPEARWVEVDKVCDLLTHDKDKKFFKLQIQRIQQELS